MERSAQLPRRMGPTEIRKISPIDETSTNLLKAAMQQMQLSARAYYFLLGII
jgi:hypothetical protein